ncbi:FimD/PapC N-terminal domain-containing protein, partial [Enterobacter hormaechei]
QNNQPVDISRFSKRGFLLPGKYYASIRVNGSEVGNENIEIKTRADNYVYLCIFIL